MEPTFGGEVRHRSLQHDVKSRVAGLGGIGRMDSIEGDRGRGKSLKRTEKANNHHHVSSAEIDEDLSSLTILALLLSVSSALAQHQTFAISPEASDVSFTLRGSGTRHTARSMWRTDRSTSIALARGCQVL
jgi:hypothetical protein